MARFPPRMMDTVTQLSNGLTVATSSMSHMKSVSVGFWVNAGSRHESERQSGISHFIEHLLFKGTKSRSSLQITQAIEGVGGYLNAYTSEELTCYYCRASAEHLPLLVDVLFDMYRYSQLSSPEIDKERQVIKEEIAMYLDQPSQYVLELLNEAMWENHPLARSITGTSNTLDRMGRPHLNRYLNKRYTPNNVILCAAGNVDHGEFLRLAKRHSKGLKPGSVLKPPTKPASMSHNPTRHLTRRVEQTNFAIGIRVDSRHSPLRPTLRILNTILGENMSSRLFQRIREDQGLAYSIYSSLGFYDDTGLITIGAALDHSKAKEAISTISRELISLASQTVSQREIRRAKDYLIGQLELSLEGTENRMTWLAEHLLHYGRVLPDELIRQEITDVTPRNVRDAANYYFRANRMGAAIISPRPCRNVVKLIQNEANKR